MDSGVQGVSLNRRRQETAEESQRAVQHHRQVSRHRQLHQERHQHHNSIEVLLESPHTKVRLQSFIFVFLFRS